jgi:hypothetical protein
MSHLLKIEGVEIPNTEFGVSALELACNEIKGLHFNRDRKTHKSYGHEWGVELGKCLHSISVEGTSWEIGVVENGNGKLTLSLDFYGDNGSVIKRAIGGERGEKIMQHYGLVASEMLCNEKGLLTEREEVDGDIRLRITAGSGLLSGGVL